MNGPPGIRCGTGEREIDQNASPTRSRRALTLAVAMAVGAASASACRTPTPVFLDLTAEEAGAVAYGESDRIDLGTPAARRDLFGGWGGDEEAGDGTTFVWGLGPSSTLRFRTLGRRPLTLSLRGWPFTAAGLTRQTVELNLNGRTLERWTLETSAATYQALIPADALRLGDNVLELRYGRHTAPASLRLRSSDTRPLAVAWDLLELAGAERSRPARVTPSRHSLEMPLGTGASYSLSLPPGAAVEFGALELPSLDQGRSFLRISLLRSGDTTTRDFDRSGRNVSWPLPADQEGRALLRLEAMWEGPRPQEGVVRLLSPVITAPPLADPAPSRAADLLPEGAEIPTNVLVYVIDALRADRLGAYGHPGALTPRIDAFAQESVVFDRAFAASSWTRASVATVLTGLSPRTHAVRDREDALPPAVTTLPERLRDLGYDTAAFVTNPNLDARFGLDRGFARYEYLADAPRAQGHVRSDALHARVMEWLDKRSAAHPFFLYVHSMDPHDPYVDPWAAPGGEAVPPSPAGEPLRIGSSEFMKALEEGRLPASTTLRERLLALYEAGIRFNDARFGELLDRLEKYSPASRTLVVLLADHGEEFADHGWWRHGKTLYAEQLHIPLIIRFPGERLGGRRIRTAARQIDIMPTVLGVLGAATEPNLPGTSLVELARGTGQEPERPIYAGLHLDGRWVESVTQDGLKLIRYLAHDRSTVPEEMFAVGRDPAELSPLATAGGAGRFLRGLLERAALAERAGVPRAAEIDAQLRQRLRAVGYIH